MTDRVGDWIQVYSGDRFFPLDPRAEEINIHDIAHSLSLICRFGGHCINFYSVAEHSVHLSYLVSKENALAALLHDGGEGYVVDVPRPIKPSLTNYKAIEDRVQETIFVKYGLPPTIPDEVKYMDYRILADEKMQNMNPSVYQWSNLPEPTGTVLQFWDPKTAERKFLDRFEELTAT